MSIIKNYYNDLADSFDSLPFVRKRNPKKEIQMIKTLIPNIGNESILDIGCGTGRLTIELNRLGAESYGIDIASKMIDNAKSKNPDIFETADFYLYSPDRKFNNALSMMGGAFGLIEDIDSHMQTTKNFFRKLNSILCMNGVGVIEFLNQTRVIREVTVDDIKNGEFHLLESVVSNPNGSYEKAYSASEIEAIAEEIGFAISLQKEIPDQILSDLIIQ